MGILSWLIVGAIAGYVAGFLVKGDESLGVIGHVALGIVGGLIGGFLAGLAWFAKRLRGGVKSGGARIQVLGAQALGPKERAVLVRVGETDILVGVGSGSVNTLHVFPAGALSKVEQAEAPPAPPAVPGQVDFKSLLMKALGK